MSHNYLSAFARVSDGDSQNTAPPGGNTQAYHNLTSIGMQQMNSSMFPTGAINSTPAHSHQQSQSQQMTSMGQVTQAQWGLGVTSASQQAMARPLTAAALQSSPLNPQMIPTTNVPMTGTPILEWNGREWITPQPTSIAAVAGQQGIPYSALTQIPGWNPQQQQQQQESHQQQNNQQTQSRQQQLQQQHNHSQQQQQVPSGGVNSFPTGPADLSLNPILSNVNTKQPRKKAPKVKRPTPSQAAKSQQMRMAQPQQLAAVQNSAVSMSQQQSNIPRTDSSEDLLAAAQLARVSGSATKEEVARESLLSLSAHQQHAQMLQHHQQPHQQQRSQAMQLQTNPPPTSNVVNTEPRPILTELLPAKPTKPVEPEKPPSPPRPVRPFDGRFAVCSNCGTMSKDYNNCDYCKRRLPDDCKMYDPVAARAEAERKKKEAALKAETERMLLIKLKQEQQKKQTESRLRAGAADKSARVSLERLPASAPRSAMSAGKSRGRPPASSTKDSKSPSKSGKTPTKPHLTTKSFYGRKVVLKDYADNDPAWTPGGSRTAARRGGGKPQQNYTNKKGRKVKETEVFIISSSDDSDEEEEEFIPAAPVRPAGRVRQAAAPARGRKKASPPGGAPGANCLGSMSRPDLGRVPELFMKCTKITMGSLEGEPKEPLQISLSGVDINMETENEAVKVRLDNRDVRECLGCTHHKLPVLFFRANESFGKKVRTALKMADPEQDPYYDPDSKNAKHKYIVGYLDDKAQISNFGWRLQEVFRAISLQYQTGGVLLRFIELKVAESILSSITGNSSTPLNALDELATSYEDDDPQTELRPMMIFTGPVKKMFTYPFPPAIGGIKVTNEDYFCLNDGEFLNDIVISFYLKYLTEQVLSEADRERTFVFSSFFYTRLTQPFTGQAAKDTKKSPAEKRHSRIKTWTKNVDIFSKDFIVVPINEHSHWYLAIICYPHLLGEMSSDGNGGEVISLPRSAVVQSQVPTGAPQVEKDKPTTVDTPQADNPQVAAPVAVLSGGDDNVVSSTTTEEISSTAAAEATATSERKESTASDGIPQSNIAQQQPQPSDSQTSGVDTTVPPISADTSHSTLSQEVSSGSIQEVTPTQPSFDQSQQAASSDQSQPAAANSSQSRPSAAPNVTQSASSTATASASTSKTSTNSTEVVDKSGLPADLFGFDSSDDEDSPKEGNILPANRHGKILKRPCILIFDSLAGPGHGPVIRALRDYLSEEWKARKGTERSFGKEVVRGANVKCPQQNNYSDCGIYLLQYVEQFFKDPIKDWAIPMKCLANWFDYPVIKRKRSEIMKLMSQIEAEFQNTLAAKKGHGRGTRASTKEAVEASKPKETTHHTSIPEALGLAPSNRPVTADSHKPAAQTEGVSNEDSAVVELDNESETSSATATNSVDEAPVNKKSRSDDGAEATPSEAGADHPGTVREQRSEDTPANQLSEFAEQKAELVPANQITELNRSQEEEMEVKEDTSVELFDVNTETSRSADMETSSINPLSIPAASSNPCVTPQTTQGVTPPTTHDVEMRQQAAIHTQQSVSEEAMQVESSSPVKHNDTDDSDMQTDAA